MASKLGRAELALALIATACATATNDITPADETAGAAGTNDAAGSAGKAPGTAGAGGANAGAGNSAGSAGARAGSGGASAGSGGNASGGAGRGGSSGTGGTAGTGVAGGGAGGKPGTGGGGAGGGSAGSGMAGSGTAGSSGNCTGSTVTLNSIYDAELNAQAPTTNAAYVAEVKIVRGGTSGSHRAVFWFDFGQVPAGKTLRSATLQLTIANNPGLQKNLALHRISQASNRKWEEPQVTWNEYKNASAWSTPGGDFVANATDTKSIADNAPSGTVLSYNVLADAQSFYATPATNYGWLIKDPLDSTNPSGESVYIATRENTTITPPKVVVVYCP